MAFKLTTYNFYDDALTYYNLGMGNNVDINGLGLGDGRYMLSTLRLISLYGRANYSFTANICCRQPSVGMAPPLSVKITMGYISFCIHGMAPF